MYAVNIDWDCLEEMPNKVYIPNCIERDHLVCKNYLYNKFDEVGIYDFDLMDDNGNILKWGEDIKSKYEDSVRKLMKTEPIEYVCGCICGLQQDGLIDEGEETYLYGIADPDDELEEAPYDCIEYIDGPNPLGYIDRNGVVHEPSI